MQIRHSVPGDLAELHRINEANAPKVGNITAEDLAALIDISFATLVATRDGALAGFVLSLVEKADYDSLNYAWISDKHESFAYVDRVAVDAAFRNQGVGQLLYEALEREIDGQRPVLTCEVNALPPNPGSMRFHERLGFRDIGRRDYDDGAKAVVYYEKLL